MAAEGSGLVTDGVDLVGAKTAGSAEGLQPAGESGGDASGGGDEGVGQLKRIPEALDEEDPLEGDLTAPTYRLHPLKGDRRGQWPVRVERAWRIVFRVEDGGVFDVDLSDYH